MKLLVENGANIHAENEVGGHSLLHICLFLTAANCIATVALKHSSLGSPSSSDSIYSDLFFGGSLALLYGSHMSDSYMENHILVAHIQTFAPQ